MVIKRTLAGALGATLALCLSATVVAEDLRVPVGNQADRSQQYMPRVGTTQDSVRAAWGPPRSIKGPVGTPPISQWHYENFVVYFEGNRTVHSVLSPERQTVRPAPAK
ncbi:hypothetical protein HLV39_08135 [Marinobacter adhaerens]|uniref:Phosphodiesterase n=1 Tax=Marinobacter adhaerens TaxID=1033846 RepID=A0A851HZU2_9GAMM|nr:MULTISPECIES: outer membrane protein assembly factor BamE [Marinobacter]NWN91461.1 hypothetical protein [Marinobacter adhaerens]